jgi:hypothetical protein
MTIPYYVRKPLDYASQIYDISTFDNRPYTHKVLEKNISGLAVKEDGSYDRFTGNFG